MSKTLIESALSYLKSPQNRENHEYEIIFIHSNIFSDTT